MQAPYALPGKIEIGKSNLETGKSTIEKSPVPREGFWESSCGGHDVYKNTRTYRKFGRFVVDRMLLIVNDLSVCLGSGTGKPGKLNFQEGPTMLYENKRKSK